MNITNQGIQEPHPKDVKILIRGPRYYCPSQCLPLLESSLPALDEINAGLALGKNTSTPGVAKPHDVLSLGGSGPVGQSVAVGVSGLDEVGPVVGHLLLNTVVKRSPGDVRVVRVGDVVEHIPQLTAVVGTRCSIFSRSVGPVVGVDIALRTTSGPVDTPAPSTNTAQITEKLVAVLIGLGLVVGGVESEELLGEITEHLSVKLLVGGDGETRRSGSTGLVGVVAGQNRDVSVSVQVKSLAVAVGEDVSVDVGTPERRLHERASKVLELGALEDSVTEGASVADELLHRQLPHIGDGGGVHLLHESHTLRLGSSLGAVTSGVTAGNRVVRTTSTGLRDHTVDQVLRQGREHHVERAGRSSGLTTNGDLVGVSTELSNVLLHPAQSELLVQQTVVSRAVVAGLGRQFGVGEKSERTDTVVHGDNNNVLAGKTGAIVSDDITRSGFKTTSVDPEVDGQVFRGQIAGVVVGWCPDIEEQAVLAGDVGSCVEDSSRGGGRLCALRAKGVGLVNARPGLASLGSLPTIFTPGSGGKGNTLVDSDFVAEFRGDTLDGTLVGLDHRILGGGTRDGFGSCQNRAESQPSQEGRKMHNGKKI